MSGRRTSVRNNEEEDCRSIFLSIYNDIDARIKTKEDLLFALQQTGRNPTSKVLNAHWKPGTRYMTCDDFLNICRRLPATTQDDLMKAFRKMDANDDGYITRNEFMTAMMSKGEKMTMDEVIDIIERVDENGDGKLDYQEFCKLILSNVDECKAAAKRKANRRQDPPRPPSRRVSSPTKAPVVDEEDEEDDDDDIIIGASTGSLRSSKSRSDNQDRRRDSDRVVFTKNFEAQFDEKEPRNLRRWTKVSRRGSLFLEDIGNNSKAVLTHQYTFSLSRATNVLIKASPMECKSLDIPAPDLNLLLLRNGKPLALGEQTGADGRATLRADLEPGDYRLYPISSGVKFRPRAAQPRSKAKLLKKDREDRLALTTACKEALSDIFKMADIDSNGFLNKKEFSIYIMRTSGEKLEDGLWEVVEENCNLVDGEISEEDFLKLNLKEAEQDNGDTENLWITLDSMGFNHQLFLDEAFPFQLDFYVEEAAARLKLDVTEMDLSTHAAIDKALVSLALQKGDIKSLPGAPDCSIAMLATRGGALVVSDNKTPDARDIKVRSGLWVDVNCAGSENMLRSNADNQMKSDLTIKPNRSELLFWMVPKDSKAPWKIVCELKKRS